MKNLFLLACMAMLILCGCGQTYETRTLHLLSFGNEEQRGELLRSGIDLFNEMHPNVQYELSEDRYVENNQDHLRYIKYFEETYDKEVVDIFLVGHIFMPYLVNHGYIVDVDSVMTKDIFSQELFPRLWESIRYNNKYYGVIDDVEAQCIFLNRSVLRAMGYSDAEIESIPLAVQRGELLLEDVIEIARFGEENDLTEYGLLHRPTIGKAYYMLSELYGGISHSSEEGISIHEDGIRRMLDFFYTNAIETGITPRNNAEMTWAEIHDIVARGQTAVFLGAVYTPFDLQAETTYSADSMDQYIPILYPALEEGQQPTTISMPMVFTITANSAYAEDIREILYLSSVQFEDKAKYSAENYHFPIFTSSLDAKAFKTQSFLQDTLYMLDYTTFMPNNEQTIYVLQDIYDTICLVESGQADIDEALEYLQMARAKAEDDLS